MFGEVRDRFSAESPADARVVCVGRVRLGSALLCALCWHVCAVSVRAAALSKDGHRGLGLSEGVGERSVVRSAVNEVGIRDAGILFVDVAEYSSR